MLWWQGLVILDVPYILPTGSPTLTMLRLIVPDVLQKGSLTLTMLKPCPALCTSTRLSVAQQKGIESIASCC